LKTAPGAAKETQTQIQNVESMESGNNEYLVHTNHTRVIHLHPTSYKTALIYCPVMVT
jgi:hypothetical protein